MPLISKSSKSIWIPIVLGIIACLLVVGPRALNPSVLELAQGVDPFKDYVGWMFFRNSPWTFPIGLNPTYGLDFSSSIVFSDSIPLMAFFFKAIRFLLPETFQYLGIWTLLCFILQAYFAWLVLGLMTQNTWLKLFACAILVFSPPMIWRVNQHTALVAHFMILAAFYLIFAPDNKSKLLNRGILWGALLSVAVLTHFSLFVMVAAIWAANLVDQILFTADRRAQFKSVLIQVLLIGLFIAFLMWQAGYFALSSSSGSLGGYGFFRMNLLSPFDPKGWSYLLRTLPLPSDYGEGYMYFGLGLLVLWPFAIYQLFRNVELRAIFKKNILPHLFLILVLVLLALFAITNQIAIGRKEFGFGISESVYAVASIFRASGRMFWPMFYALNLACLFIIINGYSKRMAMSLLGIACLLQVVDTSAGWRVMREHISNPSKNVSYELSLNAPFWDEVAKHYKQVELVPPQDKAPGWDQIALYAAKNHLATNAVFFARADIGKLSKAQQDFMNRLYSANWDPATLYVLQPDVVLPAYFYSNPGADLLISANGFAALAPNWKTCKECPAVDENLRRELDELTKQVMMNKPMLFSKGGLGNRFLIGIGGSWAWPESWGVWSNSGRAKMMLPVPQAVGSVNSPKQLKLDVRAFVSPLHPKQEVEVFIDQMPPQSIVLTSAETQSWVLQLPPNMDKRKYLELEFHFKNPVSPKDVGGVPGDDRKLGMGLISAQFQ
jgi:hypothetical protein